MARLAEDGRAPPKPRRSVAGSAARAPRWRALSPGGGASAFPSTTPTRSCCRRSKARGAETLRLHGAAARHPVPRRVGAAGRRHLSRLRQFRRRAAISATAPARRLDRQDQDGAHPRSSRSRRCPTPAARCDGFLAGFARSFDGDSATLAGRRPRHLPRRRSAPASTRFRRIPTSTSLFGVNDHSILAAIEASDRLGLDGSAASRSAARAARCSMRCCSRRQARRLLARCFPEIVGARAVDVLAGALSGGAHAGRGEDAARRAHAGEPRRLLPARRERLVASRRRRSLAEPCRRSARRDAPSGRPAAAHRLRAALPGA